MITKDNYRYYAMVMGVPAHRAEGLIGAALPGAPKKPATYKNEAWHLAAEARMSPGQALLSKRARNAVTEEEFNTQMTAIDTALRESLQA